MMKNLKKIIACLLLCASFLCLFACAPEPNDTTYTVNGLTFTIPKSMKSGTLDDYDIYYSTLATAFMARKLDAEFFESEQLSADITAEEYIDFYFEINGINKDECKVTYVERQKAYKFSFSNSPDNETYTFNYCVVLEAADAIWYVAMLCDYDSASGYLPTFETWGNSLRAE